MTGARPFPQGTHIPSCHLGSHRPHSAHTYTSHPLHLFRLHTHYVICPRRSPGPMVPPLYLKGPYQNHKCPCPITLISLVVAIRYHLKKILTPNTIFYMLTNKYLCDGISLRDKQGYSWTHTGLEAMEECCQL
jgi:hypothetical protein